MTTNKRGIGLLHHPAPQEIHRVQRSREASTRVGGPRTKKGAV
jgi:hypothetical protein